MTRYRGVVTTGIYCRDGCPATPRSRNTRPFAFAAAAEANGFRPCLRCRPDKAPGPGTWVAPSELVCRALRMIADGALDGAREDELASRLAVSPRHLRRLFVQHVGTTPDTVARSRRAHLTRRLIDETDLPFAEIAFAAGFSSVRQMNRVVKDVFRLTPTELRRRRRRADRLVADGGLDLRLSYRPPLAWAELLRYLSGRAIPGVEAVIDGSYRRTVRVDGHPGVVEVAFEDNANLRLRAHLPSYAGLAHVVARARRLFDLDADPDPIETQLGATVRGIRVPGAWDPFELGVRAILGQQVSVKAATTVAGRLAALGDPVPGLGQMGLGVLFPTPEGLASAHGLGGIGLSERRAATVRAFARAIVDGAVVLDASRPLDRVVADLCALPGIGLWTAHYIAMRACGFPDAFPAADLGIRKALSGNGELVSAAAAEERAERWRPWRAYAAMSLWLRPEGDQTVRGRLRRTAPARC